MSDSDIVQDFLVESTENLDRLDRELVGLEKNPQDRKALASVFRTIHTIKGTCGFLGFNKLEKVAHVGENLLSRLRDGQLTLNPEITTALLSMVDAVRQMLGEIKATGQDGSKDYAALQETLTRLQQPQNEVSPAAKAEPPEKPVEGPRTSSVDQLTAPGKPQKAAPTPSGEAVVPSQVDSATPSATKGSTPSQYRPIQGKLGGLLVERGLVQAEDIAHALQEQEKGDGRRIGEILVALGLVKAEDVLASQQILESRAREVVAETIRVGVNLLDKLMTLVGELVLARNQLLQYSNTIEDPALQAVSQRMNLIATELQEEVMKTRMQPIGNIWNQFPRTVRDVALGCGKEVRIEMEGKETELDKTIIEAIKDPLTHLVRNAVDHGIELPEVRSQAKKDPIGRLTLRAFHEGGQVNIEISDDGAGLNRERIRQKAIERRLITAEQADRMADRELFTLIFLPGFSTAEKVTNVSGRGVGMDVVKTNVEKIGGSVDVQSTLGHGTTVRVKIPLTLAIIPALIVSCGGDRFAIPQVSLTELVRLDASEVEKGIEMVHGVPVYRLRGRLLPLVYLSRELQLAEDANPQSRRDAATNIVVLQADEQYFGLVVDEINDTEEIVVKPLRKQLKSIKTFAGASIMGDGKVALILDVMGLAQRASVINEVRDHALSEKASEAAQAAAGKQTFLLFAGPNGSRMAVPLDALARLEELPASQVEKAGTQWVAQYRGQILPLVNLEFALEERRGAHRHKKVRSEDSVTTPLQVLVCNHAGRSVGLVVERILDIVEDSADVKHPASRAGILYSAVISGQVTELIDISAVLQAAGVSSADQASYAEAH
jgi:two-component system chemotaxis sensor kinase CheA